MNCPCFYTIKENYLYKDISFDQCNKEDAKTKYFLGPTKRLEQ